MNNFFLYDPLYQRTRSSSYHFSVQADLNGYALCILDVETQKYLVLKQVGFDFTQTSDSFLDRFYEAILNDDFFTQSYKSVHFMFVTENVTLVPAPLFDVQTISDYFDFNHQLGEFEELSYNRLNYADAYSVYTLPVYFSKMLNSLFPNAKIFHHSVPFIENFLLPKDLTQSRSMGINIHANFFDVIVFDYKRLILYNTFHFVNEKDFTYHILNIYEQLKLNPTINELIMSGELKKNSGYYENLKKFVKKIRFNTPDDSVNYSYVLNEIPNHQFINLFNLYRCE